MAYFKVVVEPYIIGVGENEKTEGGISEKEYLKLTEMFKNRPTAPDDKHEYKLKEDTLEWELTDRGGGL